MNKFLLLGTIFVATGAFAFGGIGLGVKSSSHKGGVSAIGVHINGKGKANIDIVDGDSQEESCPEERQCGDTCCGTGNICVDGNKCCFKNYADWGGNEMCCDAATSNGFSTSDWSCCVSGSKAHISSHDADDIETSCCAEGSSVTDFGYNSVCCGPDSTAYTPERLWTTETACCPNNYIITDVDGRFECCNPNSDDCCPYTIYPNEGYDGHAVCCDHEPETWEDFKVCWDQNSECKTNDDCDSGYFCNLSGDTAWHPNSGECLALDNPTPVFIAGLGTVITNSQPMNFWSAQNYCAAHGRSMVAVEEFGCYHNGETLATAGYGINEVTCHPQGDSSHINSIVTALSEARDGEWCSFFTSSNFGRGSNNMVYTVHIGILGLGGHFKNAVNDDSFALCR